MSTSYLSTLFREVRDSTERTARYEKGQRNEQIATEMISRRAGSLRESARKGGKCGKPTSSMENVSTAEGGFVKADRNVYWKVIFH